MRNEAHRFGITHHRNKRSKQAIETELDNIPGIGEKTAVELLRHFRSVKRIKTASKKEIEDIIGVSRAQKIIDFYKNENG
ncbi:excinuclease ABC subunit C [Nonlabens ulvanivorans]|uniref:Excinuclease ABC subunit C n=2 Tax=Nonlabens ulvanivorans TaxID=906888 RepID=A0A090QU86_NONUL|nr:excinuclease ABC subunit C [Nonlabens ulvanivorans]